jgi:dipeptidyl aminopeptidase/acylaminoacyl peptidase
MADGTIYLIVDAEIFLTRSTSMVRMAVVATTCFAAVTLAATPAVQDLGERQAPRPMTPEDVVTVRTPSDPRIAPDGSKVLFVVRQGDLEENRVESSIWMHDVGSGSTTQMTRAEASHGSPRWAPDGSGFAFLSNRSGSTQIWWMPIAGGEARQLGASARPVQAFEWAPDGSRIAFTAAEELPEDERTRRESGDDARIFGEAADLPRLWLLDVASEETRQLTTEDLAIQELAWAPSGAMLVVAARPSTILDRIGETELYLVDATASALRRLTSNEAVESSPVYSVDGNTIYYTASDAERFVNAESKLFRIDPASGKIDRVASDYRYGLNVPMPRPGGTNLVMTAGVRSTVRLVTVDLASGAVGTFAPGRGTVRAFDVATHSGRVAYLFTDADHLTDLWLFDDDSGTNAPVTDLNPGQREWRLGTTRVETWTSSDGAEVEGLLTLPPDYVGGQRVPLMVMLHGGPEAAVTLGHMPTYIDYHHVLAGAGWAVLRPNYRGGTNYGDGWVQGMNGDSGGGDYRDIMTGVDHLVAAGIADAERLGVMGWSWGGISTGWIVTQTGRFKAASAGAMVSNHFSIFGQADLTYDVEQFYVGGSPWANFERYLSMSPIAYVTRAKTPTLLLHGEADERCPLPQSVEFFKGLQSVGVETELVVYPREPHVFREPAHQLDKMRRETAWFTKWVRQ